MEGLFSQAQIDQINAVAAKSKAELKPVKSSGNISAKQRLIDESSRQVLEYFKDSPAKLVTTREELHEYIQKAIEFGYCAIDTETTGKDTVHDTIVGFSLYYPGDVEIYVPSKHKTLVETYYKNQLSYEDIGNELQFFVIAKTKMIFANADFDIAMIYKDFHVDMIDIFFYDVLTAWRCLKEDEPKKDLKTLYWKYPNKMQGSPKKFNDFFDPKLFPYSNPKVAKLYAAHDAKITYDLFVWQLPFVTKSHTKCQRNHLEKIADLLWNIEIPMERVCSLLHRYGLYLDLDVNESLKAKYHGRADSEGVILANMVQEIIDKADAITISKSPFKTGSAFKEGSNQHVKYLYNKFLGYNITSCDKTGLSEVDIPISKQILKVRSASKLTGTFIDKMPEITGADGRVHSSFISIGADTGRMSSKSPNMQNIPSHTKDIRHQFRATPAMLKVSPCTVDVNLAKITLGKWDTVWLSDNSEVLAYELKVGDSVRLLNHNVDCIGVVSTVSDTAPTVELVFEVVGITPTNIRIKHRTPPYVMMSSDFSQQEPKLVAFITQDPNMLDAFTHNRDIYATIAALSFNSTYEECLEFNPITGANQPEGSERRSMAKKIVLGILYGMSIPTIGVSLFGDRDDMTEDEMAKEAQKIYDAVLNAFPNLRAFMDYAQNYAIEHGYVETILGRRRHIPDMQLPMYEFHATKKYVNPDIDPLDPETLKNKNEIPSRIIKQLEREFAGFKRKGQVYRRIKELDEYEHIKVIVNRNKIQEASRKCVNCVDTDTEILTVNGWKTYDQVTAGDAILSYSMADNQIVHDTVNDVFYYPDVQNVVRFKSSTFEALSTAEHRWVVGESDQKPKILTTDSLRHRNWIPPILRVGDNQFIDNPNISDYELKNIGRLLTNKPMLIATDIDLISWVSDTFPNRTLTFDFINTLSQRQANVLMTAMLQGDGSGVDGDGLPIHSKTMHLCCHNKECCDAFQYLCFVAGYATNCAEVDAISNCYDVSVLRNKRACIYKHQISETTVSDGVWCVSTNQGTWIARRNGKVFITGNSIVQGSAAELTKIAILKVFNSEEWNALGGRVILPVHDELIAEIPIYNWKRGGELLSNLMVSAGDFLPFAINCDVTTTLRWYGLAYPCVYTKPEPTDVIDSTLSSDKICWLQYHLFEMAYQLPTFPRPDGKKLEGDEAVGVNGVWSQDLEDHINDYMNRYHIGIEEFVDHIHNKVVYDTQI